MKHTDERGTILDLLVGKNWAITYITFNPGAVRGNHFHKKTIQWDLILSGMLIGYFGKRTRVMYKWDHQKITKGRPHAYKAFNYSRMLSFTKGIRVGEDYSKDTSKLETPLI